MDVVQSWELGYSMNVNLTFPVDTQTWNATLEFDTELANLEMWSDQLETTDNRAYTVRNTMWDGGTPRRRRGHPVLRGRLPQSDWIVSLRQLLTCWVRFHYICSYDFR
ncbi:hypothetical protein FJT64_013983 [Amphibalanus amphitrite]|uniref:Uncharacterized protein n=1 Tax=Amphibalanus amphitrite TaxID=1232801 RepID=A0A6A4UYF2_AMPAM|nr:hypothetical protein FJT64_013983 [Amphibalanus amphitrite]